MKRFDRQHRFKRRKTKAKSFLVPICLSVATVLGLMASHAVTSLSMMRMPEDSVSAGPVAVLSDSDTPPLISFIVPSTLQRPTLKRTLTSLIHQSNPHWEALVGVDVTTSRRTVQEAMPPLPTANLPLPDDPRIRYVNITTPSTDRGQNKNGSGEIRNQLVLFHAKAPWVAFVDDDDTVSPYYVAYCQQGLVASNKEAPDILLFRMKDSRPAKQFWYQGILPPWDHGPVVSPTKVGISFAVRRTVFDTIRFVPGAGEDFEFLYQAYQTKSYSIKITCCIAYFVRSEPSEGPPLQHRKDATTPPCTFETAWMTRQSIPRPKGRGKASLQDVVSSANNMKEKVYACRREEAGHPDSVWDYVRLF